MTQSQSIQSIAAEKQFDTVIVGAGSAGLVSALALAEAGKRVIVLEKWLSLEGILFGLLQG